MDDERLAEIRATVGREGGQGLVGVYADRVALLAEVDRLRAELDESEAADIKCAGVYAENERLRAALNQIAAWGEGPEVTGGFDHPAPARIARAALSPKAG